MTPTALKIAPVRKQVRVKADPARAFAVFTDRMKAWWPPQQSIGRSPIADIILEPKVGGLWGERGEDGGECRWGEVLAWEPPSRLVLAWRINAEWRYDADLLTEVEVRFRPDGSGTLVELEHRLDGYGAAAEQMRGIFDGPTAWAGTLARFGEVVGA